MLEAGIFAERPSLAARYEREQEELLHYRLRVSCALALVLVPIFGVLDAVLFRGLLIPLLAIRAIMVALALGGLLLLRTEWGRRHVLGLSVLVFLQCGIGIVVMITFQGGGSSPYYAGINLVLLAAAVLIPWEMSVSIVFAALLISSYLLTCLTWAGVPDQRVFAANLFFICSTALIAAVSHRASAQTRRREFLQRVALEEAGKHRDEFLANITHELRTPLAAILGFAEMMGEQLGDDATEQRAWLRRIRENAATLYRLIVQLLDFSKIEAGALKLEREPVDLPSILSKVASNMRAIGGEEGPEVRIALEDDVSSVLGDPARIEEIVTNLAANALKFSEGHPVTLSLKPGVIYGEPAWQRLVPDPGPDAEAGAWVEIGVTDRGVGIHGEDLRRLFVAFQQLDGSSTRRQGGTGLGLAISARLAAAMHGHIAVRSAPGAGSTFSLFLPVLPDLDDGEHPQASARREPPDAVPAQQPAR
jgi:signal transduction histidine kinase